MCADPPALGRWVSLRGGEGKHAGGRGVVLLVTKCLLVRVQKGGHPGGVPRTRYRGVGRVLLPSHCALVPPLRLRPHRCPGR